MPKSNQLRLFSSALILALIFSAIFTVIAYADEGTPPADPAPTEEAPPAETQADDSASEAVVEEAAPEAEVSPQEDASSTSAQEMETDTSVSDPATVLADVPEGTEIVVLDEQSQPLSLASEESSQILLDGDPMWCPDGVAPGGVGCTIDYATFALLLADPIFAGGGPAMNGTIWVRDNYAAADSSTISFDGSVLTTMKDYKLTIKGGWTGVGSTINQAAPSLFDVRLSITAWNADVTLSDLVFNGVAGSPVLQIVTTKNISLTRVDVNSNTAALGANLNNSSGTGNVTVMSSEFNSNGSTGGLTISSNGMITLTSIIADNNVGYGANITNGGVAKTVSITSSEFSDNDKDGLTVNSLGLITLSNITANENGFGGFWGTGASLDNTAASTAQNVTITGINIFLNNLGYGLYVLSDGAISASNIYASSNVNYNGAYLNNSSAATALGVTLSGTSEFKNNGDEGLRIQSNGAVTLSNITASLNGIDGVDVNNTYLGSGAAAVSVTGTNVFYNNVSRGIDVESLGPITLAAVTANSNVLGAELDNSTAITPQNVTVSGVNTFNNNSSYGLYVNSKGAIAVNSVTANNNSTQSGAYLYNSNGSTSSLKGITITGTNVFNGNGSSGLSTGSYGPISAANLTASGNLAGNGITLYNADAATPQSVTVSGINVANSNFNSGLYVVSKGAITVSNLTAGSNGTSGTFGDGANLDNAAVGAAGAVTLSGTNVFNGNYTNGLNINSRGAISVNNVTANSNSNSIGASLSNLASTAATPQNVTISGTNTFSSNYYDGLYVQTHGAITASNVTASMNGLVSLSGSGAYLINNTATSPKSVTLTGTNKFESNQNEGIYILSVGSISISNLTASNVVNGKGAYLYNLSASSAQNVTLSGTNIFDSNDGNGLWIQTLGAISVSNVQAGNNGTGGSWSGAYLSNQTAATPQNVTISGTNIFVYNTWIGLEVLTKGSISLSKTTAIGNSSSGASLINTYGATNVPKSVTVTGPSQFNSNPNYGLYVESYGLISLSNVTAFGNLNGADLINNGASGLPQNVTIAGTNSFSSNTNYGLYVITLGAITGNNITATNNVNLYGAQFLNQSAASAQNVTLTGTNVFNANWTYGLIIHSKGVISINNLTASDNVSNSGALLDNSYGTPAGKGVTLTGMNTLNSNNYLNLEVDSFGAISVSNLTSLSSVTDGGANLDNCQWSGSICDGTGNVTLSGTNNLSFNNDTGLFVWSNGAISASNITASNNGDGSSGLGAYLKNNDATAVQNITLSGINVFSTNDDSGLLVVSKGTVTINSTTANSNDAMGAIIENDYGSTSSLKGVTLTGTNTFNANIASSGLVINSYGPIKLANVTANSNGEWGAIMGNDVAAAPQLVAFTGINTFNGNTFAGLVVSSKGAITSATSMTANGNLLNGAQLTNTTSGAVGGVTLSGTNNFSNSVNAAGLVVNSLGAITINNLTASGNGTGVSDYGANLVNHLALTPMNVTLTGVNTFNDNGYYGLNVLTLGAVSLNSVTANDNDAIASVQGVVVDNQGTDGKAVTFSGTNSFNGNTGNGLQIWSKGAVTLNNITANDNSVSGADIQNYTSVSAPQFVKLNGTNVFNGNTDTGLQVISRGAITVNNLTANSNLNGGALLDNDETGATAASTITLTGTHYFNENTNLGLRIRTTSTVTLSKLTADDNTGKGVEITANTGNITLACASITSNGSVGLDIISSGPTVTLKGVIASGNTGGNINSVVTPVIVRTCP